MIAVELLRGVADPQVGLSRHATRVGVLQAEQHPHQGRLAGTVEPDEGDNLTPRNLDVDPIEYQSAVKLDDEPVRFDQGPSDRLQR